jgi:hypothetical protein
MEQLLLPVFMLMLLVGIAGGNPGMVVKPLFDIVSQLVGALIQLLSTLIVTLFRAACTLVVSAIQAISTMIINSRNINR